ECARIIGRTPRAPRGPTLVPSRSACMSRRKSPLLVALLPLALASPFAFAQDAAPPAAEQEAQEPADQAPPPQEAAPAQTTPADEDKPAQEQEEAPAAPATDEEQDAAVAASDDPDAVESAATKVPLEEIRRYVGLFN